MFDKMKMKEKLLEELIDELDQNEGEKLKPKAAMIAVGHSDEDSTECSPMDKMLGKSDDDDDEDEESLKMLLNHYQGE